ncbi:flagellar hook assembly protein FlgD [Actinoplanes sp. NPDC000266]
MTSPTSGSTGPSGTFGAGAAAAAGKAAVPEKPKSLGDKDTFLKLLVAQLKYQDPSKPADSTQFLAQTAQFTQVEKLGEVADMLKGQQLVGASSLVGKTVTYMDESGAKLTGVISAAKLNGDSEPTLRIGNTEVQLSKVMEIQTQADAAAQAAAMAAPLTPPAGAPPAAAPPAPKPAPAAAPTDKTSETPQL